MANTLLAAGALVLLAVSVLTLAATRTRRERKARQAVAPVPSWNLDDVAARAAQSEEWYRQRLDEIGPARPHSEWEDTAERSLARQDLDTRADPTAGDTGTDESLESSTPAADTTPAADATPLALSSASGEETPSQESVGTSLDTSSATEVPVSHPTNARDYEHTGSYAHTGSYEQGLAPTPEALGSRDTSGAPSSPGEFSSDDLSGASSTATPAETTDYSHGVVSGRVPSDAGDNLFHAPPLNDQHVQGYSTQEPDPFGADSDPFAGAETGDAFVQDLNEEIDEELDEELSERWEAALVEEASLVGEEDLGEGYEGTTAPLTWSSPGPAPLPLFDTITRDTPFAYMTNEVASLLDLGDVESSSDEPVQFAHGTQSPPRRRGRISRLLRRRASLDAEPVILTEDRAFQTESHEHRAQSAYDAPTVEVDTGAVGDEPLFDEPLFDKGAEKAPSPAPAVWVEASSDGSEGEGAGEEATLDEPATIEDLRTVSVLDITSTPDMQTPVRTKRSLLRRRGDTAIEKLDVDHWESWNAPDAFGEASNTVVVDSIPVEEPENTILASSLPELPLSFELDDLPDDFDTELSFFGPSTDFPHTIDDGIVIAAAPGTARKPGRKSRSLLRKATSKQPSPDRNEPSPSPESDTGVSSWFDASVRVGPTPALTPGDIVDYTRHDLPEAIPDRVAVVNASPAEE